MNTTSEHGKDHACVATALGVCVLRTSHKYATCNTVVLATAPIISRAVDVTAPEVLSLPTNSGTLELILMRGNTSLLVKEGATPGHRR